MRPVAASLFLLLTRCADPAPPPRQEAVPAGPGFAGVRWVDPPPDLAGKVALVRWWTNG